MGRLNQWISRQTHYITEDIWQVPLKDLPRKQSFIIRQLRIIVLAIKGFREDKIQLRASALTFYSLLSVVPVVAMLFGIAKGFGFEKRLQAELMNSLSGHQEVLDYVMNFAQSFLENTSGGFVFGIGLVLLFWSVMQVLGHIEGAFNFIWQIKKSRPWVRKFSDYFSIMFFAPVFIILSSSATVYLSTQIDHLTQQVALLGAIRPLIVFLLKFTPYFLMWLVFTLLYLVMPNTRVSFRSALVAGILAGTIFQLTQWAYIHFQVGVSRYNAIYGSFAAFPLFLMWLQISWLIVLLGAEISFANQNVDRYEYESDSLHISQKLKRILSLLVVSRVVKDFRDENPPATAGSISEVLKIPVRIAREIIYELVQAGIFTEIQTEKTRERAYQPALDIHQISLSFVIQRLESAGTPHFTLSKNKDYQRITEVLETFEESVRQSPSNILMKDL